MSTQTVTPESVTTAKRVTTQTLQEMKAAGVPIAMLTAYDYTTARIIDAAGIDVILVGDSASNVMAGNETTLPITLDQMIYHAQCVVRAVKRALVVVDLPFGSYQGNSNMALRSAIRVMKESGAHAVKLEGGMQIEEAVRRIVAAGIPVMGHLGLTPQSVQLLGTRLQGASLETARELYQDAVFLQEAGVFSSVLEKVPRELAQAISDRLDIPTIGIGSGAGCDGQVLVYHDLLGLYDEFNFKFVKRYAGLADAVRQALMEYRREVKEGKFPEEKHAWSMTEPEYQRFREFLDEEERKQHT